VSARSKGIVDLSKRFKELQDKDLAVGGWDFVLERLSDESDEENFRLDEADADRFRPDESWASSDSEDSEVSMLSGNMRAMLKHDKIRYLTIQNLPDWSKISEASSSSSSNEDPDESADTCESVYQISEQWPFTGRCIQDAGVEVFWQEILMQTTDAESGSSDEDEAYSI
jgi:hypothetical protein